MNEAKNYHFHNEAQVEAYKNGSDLKTFLMTKEEILKIWPDADLSNIGMTLNRYQKEAAKNKSFPEKYAIIYPTIGVLNEAGEMAGKIKKWMRGDVPTLNVPDLVSEMGDVLWYLASLATDLNVTLEDVALSNIEKITKRREKNLIKGDGDHREDIVTTRGDSVFVGTRELEPFIGDILDPNRAENDKAKSDYIKSFKQCKD